MHGKMDMEWQSGNRCYKALMKKYRLVMLLYYVDGFKIREISENPGYSGGNGKRPDWYVGEKQLADEMKMERGRTL